MFEQDVAGLIKSLRSNKNEEIKVIKRSLIEIKKEIKSIDFEIKSNSILKLVYLEMLGYSISFSNFTIIECMSSLKFNIKFIGYLAASQCFDKETEVAVLIVNLVKKDLLSPPTSSIFTSSPSSLSVSHLLSTLSSVSLLLTPSLARELAPTILSLLNHSKPTIRKQTTLVLYRVVKAYPGVKELSDGLPNFLLEGENSSDSTNRLSSGAGGIGNSPWIERLREGLSDDDLGVVSATVNLICELARKDPESYLGLAPELFGLLTGSTNNWMLIKIIKLFAVLTPIEPRLIKKLVPPLTELIETTSAMSLLFECIQTSIVGGILQGREGEILANTCVDKLKSFLVDYDQNLRYIALVALVKLLPTHPHLVSKHHTIILNCIDDPDMSIRSRALDLIEGMVDRNSLESIVERLMGHLIPSITTSTSTATTTGSSAALLLQQQQSNSSNPSNKSITPPPSLILTTSYKISLINLILRISSNQSTYSNISNFNWYLDILISLTYITSSLPLTFSLSSSTTTLNPAGGGGGKGGGRKSIGKQIKFDLIDVTTRVKAIRGYAVEKCCDLLADEMFLEQEGSGSWNLNLNTMVGETGLGEGEEVEEVLGAAAFICGEYCRELINLPLTIATLFSPPPSLINSSSRILTQFFFNGFKIFNYWLLTLTSTDSSTIWKESIHKESVREVTIALMGKLDFVGTGTRTGGGDVELLERCSEIKALLNLVRRGLDGPRISRSRREFPSDPSTAFNEYSYGYNGENQKVQNEDDTDQGGFNAPPPPEEEEEEEEEEGPPMCLSVLSNLFQTQFELNYVNPKAQSIVSVQVPEGLDLNFIINPTRFNNFNSNSNSNSNSVSRGNLIRNERTKGEEERGRGEVDEYGRIVGGRGAMRRGEEEGESGGRKGKGRERDNMGGGLISNTRRRRKEIVQEEDPVEIARLKTERLERQRYDPYYVGSKPFVVSSTSTNNKSTMTEEELELEIDSIPIVQLSLEDLNQLPSSSSSNMKNLIQTPSDRKRRNQMMAGPVFVDLEGEMPDESIQSFNSNQSTRNSTPIPPPLTTTTTTSSSLLNYQQEEASSSSTLGINQEDRERKLEEERRAKETLAVKVVKKKKGKKNEDKVIVIEKEGSTSLDLDLDVGEKKKKKKKEEKVVVVEE